MSTTATTTPSRVRVSELVSKHSTFIEGASPPLAAARSPSNSPTSLRTVQLPSGDVAPPSPSPGNKRQVELLDEEDGNEEEALVSAGTPLEDIAEDEPVPNADGQTSQTSQTNGETMNGSSHTAEDVNDLEEGEVDQVPATEPEPTSPRSKRKRSDTTLQKVLDKFPAMSIREQERIQANLDRVGSYPPEMPLSASWNTSAATKHAGGPSAEQYTDSQTTLFVATTVPELCGSLKAYKRLVKPKRHRGPPPPADSETMGVSSFRPGQNLHFFRTGIQPTWEDPFNQKGGRLTISPPSQLLDATYERLVLLLAGASLELNAAESLSASKRNATTGIVTGVVASRRARGDRIELWLSGAKKKEAPPMDWVDSLKEVLSVELEMPEVRTGKFKRHL